MQDQIQALPAEAVDDFERLSRALEVNPWDSDPYVAGKPAGPLRTRAFGEGGLVTFLVLEDQRRDDLLLVQWA
ncbi:hypothetical protein [Actinomycetospora straminea]|uniref:hypothetical protein n=1 Tax=Actinomycetospora straminea TaxID=663607 RepID=UPI0023672B7A|nr:hypothetical protein [Actinomycetospora straminea]